MAAPAPAPLEGLTEAQWAAYDRDGFLVLDCAATEAEVAALNERLDDIMQGRVQYGERLVMQLDPSSSLMGGSAAAPAPAPASAAAAAAASEAQARSAYAALGTEFQSVGFKGPSLAYRKIGEAQAGLECDPVFLAYMRRPLFRAICARVYGAHAGIAVYRAMVMSKPAGELGGGTPLPWHQDGGNWWALDRDPLCFVWLALSAATAENGAVEVVRGSHRLGLLSQRGHTLSPGHVERLVEGAAAGDVVKVLLRPGQAFLAHNWLIHRSGTNTTGQARRGFSVNFIDARTRVLSPKPADAGELGKAGEGFPMVFEAQWPPA